MVVFIVLTQSTNNRFKGIPIIVKKSWIENPKVKEISKIFFSRKKSDKANFNLDIDNDFNLDIENITKKCYRGLVWQQFSKLFTYPFIQAGLITIRSFTRHNKRSRNKSQKESDRCHIVICYEHT